MTRDPKKSDSLEIRLPHETKTAFMAACRRDGVSASAVLRRCIAHYLARRASPMKEPAMPIFAFSKRRTALATAVTVALGAAALTVPARAAVDPRTSAVFEWIDANHDGAISGAEFVGAMADPRPLGAGAIGIEMTSTVPPAAGETRGALFDRLDADRDGRLTVEELAAGAVVRTIVSPQIAAADANRDGRITEAELAAYLTSRRAAAGLRDPSAGVGLMARGIIAAAGEGDSATLADLRR